MKNFTITEEQIKDLMQGKVKRKLKTMFPEAFEKKELEFGKWYKYGKAILNYQGVKGNLSIIQAYGIVDNSYWLNTDNCGDTPNEWTPVTDEEVKQALEKECIKRFGEDWQNVKIEKILKHTPLFNSGFHTPKIYVKDNQIWNKNGCIFNNGEWAEPLKQLELTMQEIADKFEIKVENLTIKN